MKTRETSSDITPQAIRSIRLNLNENQAELGRRLGVWPNSVSRWETGRVVPKPKILMALLRLVETVEQKQGILAALDAAGIPVEQLNCDSRGTHLASTKVTGALHNVSITPAAEGCNV
jgi:transcriptional regulator with XRE-family HTH domain